MSNNFLDIAVLEWCKLFADRKGKHHWRRALLKPDDFESSFFEMAGITPTHLEECIDTMRTYRDKFVAHLDEEKIANIPNLRLAEECVELLHTYIRQREHDSLKLPTPAPSYRSETRLLEREANRIYESLRAT